MRFLPSIIYPRFMNCVKGLKPAFFFLAWIAAGLLFLFPFPVHAGEEFSFDVGEFEKKTSETNDSTNRNRPKTKRRHRGDE